MPEPLVMTLAEAMETLDDHHYSLSYDGTLWMAYPTWDDNTFERRTWPEAVSAALRRPVVERDDKAALVEAARRAIGMMELSDHSRAWATLRAALAAVGEGEA